MFMHVHVSDHIRISDETLLHDISIGHLYPINLHERPLTKITLRNCLVFMQLKTLLI